MERSNFQFLSQEFPILSNLATSAEYNLYEDTSVSSLKLRQFQEKLIDFMFETHHMEAPYDDSLINRIKALTYEDIIPADVVTLIHNVRRKCNVGIHGSEVTSEEARGMLFSSFKIAKWFYETYSDENDDISGVKFSPPKHLDARHAFHLLEQEYAALEAKFNDLLLEKERTQLTEEKKQEIKQRSEKAARNIDLNEAETRELIDAQLKAAGWEVDTRTLNYKDGKTLPEKGRNMAIAEWPIAGKWADYALFIDQTLYGIIEAKRYAQDISTDLQQAKNYAERVEEKNNAKLLGKWRSYKVPFLFSTNGRPYLKQIETKSGIWFLDVREAENHAYALQGWYSPEGLEQLLEQDIQQTTQKLQTSSKDFLRNDAGLALRDYQIQAINAIEATIVNYPDQKRALVAMATGTGKTRTILGLCYRLIKANRFKRILFLVDRTLLGEQAEATFKDSKIEDLNSFANIYQVENMKSALPDIDTRLHFATVQSMVKRLFYRDENDLSPVATVDTYDCIIIDEAHRGYTMDKEIDEDDLSFKNQMDYVSKYRMVLDYFDAYKIGLTATPALHTSEIFGKPVFNYSYREAVIDGYLIDHEPPYNIKTQLNEEGILWEKGDKPQAYDKETNQIIELDELEDELKIEVDGFNRMVLTENFNRTVIKELVNHLDPEEKAKTLVFAATDEHADTIVKIFKEEFEEMGLTVGDEAVKKITGKSYNVKELVKRYKNEQFPNIAVTVDLLTTGIDVPPISNLVFMRRVKSRILYEQMLGRATRRCDDIGKETFRIFDAVRMYEALEDLTNMKPVLPNPTMTFGGLVEEVAHITTDDRLTKQVEQLVAKLQRKKKKITGHDADKFSYTSGGQDPEAFINMLKGLSPSEIPETLSRHQKVWQFLDAFRAAYQPQLYSEHEDRLLEVTRGYGKAQKPEDYIESFRSFVQENINQIVAINLICTKPAELDRKSLKELYLALDAQGFTSINLREAWKAAKNEEIAADIISFIRTLALGSALVDQETRVKQAMQTIRASHSWNRVQEKWLSRFEKQLIQETILRKEDLDEEPFREEGGYQKLNKIFKGDLDNVLNTINENLYTETA